MKDFAWMLALAAEFHDAVQQLQGDKFFAGHYHIGIILAIGPSAEEIPRLVDGLGSARQDQRPGTAKSVSVGDDLVGAGTMNLHAGDEQHLRQLAVEPGLARLKMTIPLAQDNSSLGESGFVQSSRDGARTRGQQTSISEKERPKTSAIIKRI